MPESTIEVDQLSFRYPGTAEQALKGATFHVARGEVFGFLGPSGAGKTTTQKILIGLLRGYGGEVRALGKNLADWGGEYYERIGVSFEFPSNYARLTALENLRFFASLYSGATEDPARLLERVGLEDDGDRYVAQFSKGMHGRLNVARSLINKPDLLFLDEPTAGLDPVNAQRIRELIRAEQERGTTVFLTTHNMAVADELCDRVAFIVDGHIKLIDEPRTLKLRYGAREVQVEYLEGDRRATHRFPLDDLGENEAFLDMLKQKDIETMHTLETTLEDVFIQVTGRRLH